ncbi:MAG TPA: hypothetical protein VG890_05125, partial [Puia sp.]|nr:hypothetical protein [Puia sp.]
NAFNGAVTTAADYINFLGMLLNKGTFEGKTVLSGKSVKELETLQFPTLPVKFVPKEAAGYKTALGCWLSDDGNTVASLNEDGFWPYIDLDHGYAAIIVPKSGVSEPKPELYVQLRQHLEASFGAGGK